MIWLDAHFSPRLAKWITAEFDVSARPLREMDLHYAEDREIFVTARENGVTVISKDRDFFELVQRLGAPPWLVWVRVGNTSEEQMRKIFAAHLPEALRLLQAGEEIVEIR